MKKTNCISIFLIIVATILSCKQPYEYDGHHPTIRFVCWGDKPIYIRCGIDWHGVNNPFMSKEMEKFNDIDLQEKKPALHFGKIMPGKVDLALMNLGDDCYESYLKEKDSVVISVFDAERLEAGVSNGFLVCYMLSREDLIKIHFQASYPPTEDMRDIYMYPAYEEVLGQSMHNDSIQ